MRRAALLLLVSRVAVAQPTELQKEFQAGVDAFRLGKYDEARAHLEAARTLDPKLPGPHRFLAAVAQAQSRWPDCIDSAHKALEAVDTKKLYEACRISAGRSSARTELGDSAAISVVTNAPGATVKINGLTYGGTPLAPRPITAGPLDVEIDKPGWIPIKKTVNALAGIVTDVYVDLEPDPNGPGSAELDLVQGVKLKLGYLVVPSESGALTIDDAAPPALTNGRFELPAGTHVVELQRPGKDPWRRRVRIAAGQKTTLAPDFVDTAHRTSVEKRGYIVLGAGAAVLAGGFVAAMLSRDAANEARDIVRIERSRNPAQPLSETAPLAPVRTRADLQDARERHSKWAMISTGLYATGLIAAGVGAYFIYKGSRPRRGAPPPFAIAPVQGGAVIAKELAW
jgi:hypothetical protein